MVEINFFILSTSALQCDNLKVLCIDDRRHCGKQGQLNGGDNATEVGDIIGLLPLVTGVLLTLLHLDNVTNLGVVTNI